MLISFIRKNLFVLTTLLFLSIYLLLAFKNPFSTRSLIPNLEPFPDTLYYAVPAFRLADGKGFVMEAYGREVKTIVPPLYSWYLAPFFLAYPDIRVYYLANIILGLSSFIFFMSVIRLLTKPGKERVVAGVLAGFFYSTSYYIYNLPSLLMAENMTLFLGLFSFYFLFSPISKTKTSVSGYLGLLLLLTKFANAPIAIAFHLAYGWRVWREKGGSSFIFYLLNIGLSGVLFLLYVWQSAVFKDHVNLTQENGFTTKYFLQNFIFYFKSILGGEARYLWYKEYLVSKPLAWLGILGFVWSLFSKKFRKESIFFLGYIFSVVIFMSGFYFADVRYILLAIPLLIYGMVFLFAKVSSRFSLLITVFFAGLIFVTNLFLLKQAPSHQYKTVTALRSQLALNLRYAQTPWHYQALEHFNKHIKDQDAYLGTFLPPFYVSLFSGESYNYLPISERQEFSSLGKDFLGLLYEEKLIDLYQELVDKGEKVYVSNYYTNNIPLWERNFEELEEQFELELVAEGCLDTCNLYLLIPVISEDET